MMIFGAPLLISPAVRYGATAALGALAAWWLTSTYYANRIDALKASHETALNNAIRAAADAEARIQSTQARVIERVIVKQATAQAVAQEARHAIDTDSTPSLHDPRCAWPERVRDAVNRARTAGAPEPTAEPDAALRNRTGRQGRDDPR